MLLLDQGRVRLPQASPSPGTSSDGASPEPSSSCPGSSPGLHVITSAPLSVPPQQEKQPHWPSTHLHLHLDHFSEGLWTIHLGHFVECEAGKWRDRPISWCAPRPGQESPRPWACLSICSISHSRHCWLTAACCCCSWSMSSF